MGVKVGDVVARVDDGVLFDSKVVVQKLGGVHASREAAVAEARAESAGAARDAIVLEEDGRYRVAVVGQLGAKRTVYDVPQKTVGVFSDVAQRGVRIMPTRGEVTRYESIRTWIRSAGFSPDAAEAFMRDGLTASAAQSWLTTLAKTPLDVQHFGPRLLLTRLSLQVLASGADLRADALVEELLRYRNVVVVRPDGYVQSVTNGLNVTPGKLGEPRLEDGALLAGALTVGALYIDAAGVYFAAGDNLERKGAPLAERPLRGGLGVVDRGLDGAEHVLKGALQAIPDLVRFVADPKAALADVPAPLDVARALIAATPEVYARFVAMPPEDQAGALAELAGFALMTGATLSTASAPIAQGPRTLTLDVPVALDHALALSTVSIDVTPALVGAQHFGAALGVAIMARRMPQLPSQRTEVQQQWDAVYGRSNRTTPDVEGLSPPVVAPPVRAVLVDKRCEAELREFPTPVLDKLAAAKERLARGETLAMPLSRPMGPSAPGLFELRFTHQNNQYRVFYEAKDGTVRLAHAIFKNTEATPKAAIQTSLTRLRTPR